MKSLKLGKMPSTEQPLDGLTFFWLTWWWTPFNFSFSSLKGVWRLFTILIDLYVFNWRPHASLSVLLLLLLLTLLFIIVVIASVVVIIIIIYIITIAVVSFIIIIVSLLFYCVAFQLACILEIYRRVEKRLLTWQLPFLSSRSYSSFVHNRLFIRIFSMDSSISPYSVPLILLKFWSTHFDLSEGSCNVTYFRVWTFLWLAPLSFPNAFESGTSILRCGTSFWHV